MIPLSRVRTTQTNAGFGPKNCIFGPKFCIFLRYTHITPIFWGQTDPTQWDHKSPISWGNSGYLRFSGRWLFGRSAGCFLAPIAQSGSFWAQSAVFDPTSCFCAKWPLSGSHEKLMTAESYISSSWQRIPTEKINLCHSSPSSRNRLSTRLSRLFFFWLQGHLCPPQNPSFKTEINSEILNWNNALVVFQPNNIVTTWSHVHW